MFLGVSDEFKQLERNQSVLLSLIMNLTRIRQGRTFALNRGRRNDNEAPVRPGRRFFTYGSLTSTVTHLCEGLLDQL